MINRLDEVTVIALFPLAMLEFYRNYRKTKKLDLLSLLLLFSIVLVAGCGILSGMLNGNILMVTLLGTFAYIKYFLFIFIYAAFFRDFDAFMRLFRLLLFVAVFIGIVAILQEIWVIYSSFFAVKDSPYKGVYVFISKLLGVNDILVYGSGWRLGIYRATSLLSHYNLLGLYSLLILTIYLNTVKKVNVFVFLSLLSGVVTSVARTVYMGFILLAGLQIFSGRKWIIVFLIPVGISLVFMGMLGDNIDVSKMSNDNGSSYGYQERLTYREFAKSKALNVWRDYPILGVGPGMFGGSIAFKYVSPVYLEYHFDMILKWFYSLDQLWPQALAEMGIVGTGALAGLFIVIFLVFYTLKVKSDSEERRGFFTGILTFTLIFLFYTFAGNLNIVSVLLPFCAFAGVGLGCERLQDFNNIEIEKEK